MKLDRDEIKRQASGRWVQILQSVCGLTADQLNPSVHGPCPQCKGTDRFRALDDVAETGGLICSQCFSKNNGDGFAAVQWLRNCTFSEALKLVVDEIGQTSNGHHKQSQTAKAKKVHATSEQAADALAWGMVQSGTIPEQREPDACWRYRNADGSDAGAVYRWNLPDGGKEIRQASRIDTGWTPAGWITSAMPEPRPLYRLPDIIDAAEVWICEGEKAADAAVLLGLQATTSAGGSGAAEKSNWQPLDGKRVYILPDNDEPGEKFTRTVVTLLRKQAPNATVEVKRLREDWPTIPGGGDVYDWSEQFDSAEVETLRARLQALPNRIGECDTLPEKEASNEETKSTENAPSFAGQSAPELWSLADEPVRWMVEDVFSLDQPTVIGARKKSLKTTLLSSLVVSLVTGLLWLSRFKIPQKFRVLFITGEATKRAAIRKIRRAADALNVRADDLEGLRIEAVNFPKFPSESDLATISEDIELHKIDIVVVDPLYRGMDSTINAQNIFAMGDALAKFMAACRPASVILSHHVKKSAQFDKSGMPDLDDLSQAGVAEFAGNYMLIGRLAKYQGDGQHDLAISGGGRDEQFFEYRLQFDERKFTGHLTDLKDHEAHRQQQEENSKVVETIGKIIEELKALPDHQTSESSLAALCSTKPDRKPFREALKTLENRGAILCLRDFKPPNSKTCKGWKLVELTSDKPTSDSV